MDDPLVGFPRLPAIISSLNLKCLKNAERIAEISAGRDGRMKGSAHPIQKD